LYQWDAEEEGWEPLGPYSNAIEYSADALWMIEDGKRVIYLLLVCYFFQIL
jgi:hypothetical protein